VGGHRQHNMHQLALLEKVFASPAVHRRHAFAGTRVKFEEYERYVSS